MQKILHVLRIIVKTLLCAAAGILLIYNVLAIAARLKSDGGVPTVFGFAGAAVVSGSMEPTISVGDFIVTKAQDGYFVGDVVMYYDSARGETVTHRIIAAENGWFVTQGDANNVPDDYSVPQSAIVGKVVLVVGGAGNAIRFLQSPAGFFRRHRLRRDFMGRSGHRRLPLPPRKTHGRAGRGGKNRRGERSKAGGDRACGRAGNAAGNAGGNAERAGNSGRNIGRNNGRNIGRSPCGRRGGSRMGGRRNSRSGIGGSRRGRGRRRRRRCRAGA